MEKKTLRQQLKTHSVAIISLFVAIAALLYTGWREETTERNRTLRTAGFEVLKNLGQLQIVVNNAYYNKDTSKGNIFLGWGYIALIGDISQLLPEPVPTQCAKLVHEWAEDVEMLQSDEKAVDSITTEIDNCRSEVLHSIKTLR